MVLLNKVSMCQVPAGTKWYRLHLQVELGACP
jgi:hypothetical protein